MTSDAQSFALQELLKSRDPRFTDVLTFETRAVEQFSDALALNTFRRKALRSGLIEESEQSIRVAIVGGATLRPLADLIEHFLSTLGGYRVDLWTGEFDNYQSEILDPESELYAFEPGVVLFLPSEARCIYEGGLFDSAEEQLGYAERSAATLLGLCEEIHKRSGAEVLAANFRLSPRYDPGALRSTSLRSEYSFRKALNLYLGLKAPSFVHVCDVEFLANRLGTIRAYDSRSWFESKQPYSSELLVPVAREVAHMVSSLRRPPKKVVVLDLDNTLWGGVVGDDGVEGIEIGTTSPRGEAFRAFQHYLKSLTERGILLAVASKNDHEKAIEPFLKHPEMILKLEDIVSFKANWDPKSENIRQMATELTLGLDSFVFVDDNPAEIEIVRQFVPEVTAIHVGEDPSLFVEIVQDARLFETRSITSEDVARSAQYKQEALRQVLKSTATDMDSYLTSLEMVGTISDFTAVDAPRISQLINKSNQFNLTTRRRTETEVLEIMRDPESSHFTIRLSDKFGAHGLIAIVIGKVEGEVLRVDTWLMSCRVLKRQVEEETLNEIVRRAAMHGCKQVLGEYFRTAKNGMVAELYRNLGFETVKSDPDSGAYILDVANYLPKPTKIAIERCSNG